MTTTGWSSDWLGTQRLDGIRANVADASVFADNPAMSFNITLLGTGSPRPSLARHHPAALVQWGDVGHMLVDAGDGVVN